jgi:hypothetical protein
MNSLSSSPHGWDRSQVFASYPSLEGAQAIHVETPAIFHVRMSHISCDAWGVKATAVDLLTHGMHRPRQSPFEISACWEIFSFSADYWQAHYAPWQVFFDPEVVRRCIELGAQANQKGSTIAWYDAKQVFTEYRRKVSNQLWRMIATRNQRI